NISLSKFSRLFSALPPDTTLGADPNSGLSLFCNSSPTHSVKDGFSDSEAGSVGALLSPCFAAGKAVLRTVTTFTGSLDFTFAIALPIYNQVDRISSDSKK